MIFWKMLGTQKVFPLDCGVVLFGWFGFFVCLVFCVCFFRFCLLFISPPLELVFKTVWSNLFSPSSPQNFLCFHQCVKVLQHPSTPALPVSPTLLLPEHHDKPRWYSRNTAAGRGWSLRGCTATLLLTSPASPEQDILK